ncbi:PSP1 C-terminal conserved region-domain-containing protein [Chlamydoabsidia padenii]|nr:PSP1 C-terminal conserved region-domain-containing protein [Chlamydoabsidia padenii]
MSLSDFSASNCWSPLLTDSHHDTESTMDLIGGHGRRHSVAGPFMNKPLISSSKSALNGKRQDSDGRRPSFNDMAIDYTMNAINEDDSTSYFSTHYSRQQQHFLNRGVLEHIDEYFGGSTHGHVQNDSHLLSTGKPYSSGNYMDNDHQHSPLHYTTTTGGTMVPYYSNNTPHLNKAMTAGGDAASFGCSNVLMGKGIPLHHFLDSNTLLYIVEFKTSRTDICYIMQGDQVIPRIGDLVIIEADRGRDLGKVINVLTANDIMKNQNRPQQSRHLDAPVTSNDPPTNGTADDNVEGNNDTGNSLANGNDSVCGGSPLTSGGETTGAQKCHVKRLYRLANSEEKLSLTTKLLDEKKALMVCQAKIKQKELPMQVVDAEYQWDRRKLTFYFLADQRIDFRELVRELFKTYKTRIWMCAIKSDSNGGSTGQE